ncbi:hypothetical protein Zmor_001841 [Zophobas morio]|uniref:Uncharacterized protein n=1 Tax=Zophobas morio TaxID=2755281 RepID=A0AA38HQ11_9CUCU|nr:hypothetical protein Zmor_027434 [Zophobas morio]KAJ3666398.1 hypothetical protein Zmor_001841 [Zophobas morio]
MEEDLMEMDGRVRRTARQLLADNSDKNPGGVSQLFHYSAWIFGVCSVAKKSSSCQWNSYKYVHVFLLTHCEDGPWPGYADWLAQMLASPQFHAAASTAPAFGIPIP